MGRLIVINGSIASGKTTVSRLLAAMLREHGRSVAVVELDRLYEMLADDPKSDAGVWISARRLSSALARQLCSDGFAFIVIDGAFWTAGDRRDLLSGLTSSTLVSWVTLTLSFAEALRRAQSEPSRGISKNPAFLAPHVAECLEALARLPATERVISTEDAGAAEIARVLAELALGSALGARADGA
jgi:hypothetical protein